MKKSCLGKFEFKIVGFAYGVSEDDVAERVTNCIESDGGELVNVQVGDLDIHFLKDKKKVGD